MPHAVALYDSKTLRAVETASQAHGDSFALMQLAGQASWRHLLSRWPQAQSVAVICGSGNNGGDGYVLATLALQSGREVRVLRLRAPRSELAQRACREFEAAGGQPEHFPGKLPPADVVVDAVFGIGLARAPDADSSALIDAVNAQTGVLFALDVPSGVDADTGNVPGAAVRAMSTLQFLAPHPGLMTGAAIDYCGHKAVISLGVELDQFAAFASALRADALNDWLKPRQRDSHKGRNGHVLCIGGDRGSGGAILLCADAALRCGAGLVVARAMPGHIPRASRR